MRYRPLVLVAFLAQFILAPFVTPALAENTPSVPAILITEIKLGDPAAATAEMPKEYVSLYNSSDQPVSLSGWKLEYAKSSFDNAFCGEADWSAHSISESASATALSGTLQPGEVSAPIVRQLTDSTSGSLHLVDSSNAVQDLIGWGTASKCFSGSPAAIPANAKSLQRFIDCVSSYPVNTGDNSADFGVADQPSPLQLGTSEINCPPASNETADPEATASCEGAIFSETLPNPSGADEGSEYIELYNPTSGSISLSGCGLQVGGSSKIYNLGDQELSPGQYKAFSETGLTLPNSAGGTIYLLSPQLEELASVNYKADLDDGVAWAWFGADSWKATFSPTPNGVNIDQPEKPCAAGLERNQETGRCRSIETASVSIPGAKSRRSKSLTACKPGQTRNPATNRCRAVAKTASALKVCPAGQERNPATNRCRKSVGGGALARVQDVSSGVLRSRGSWYLAGLALIAAVGYGAWEWRHDLANFIARRRQKW